jgi:threo-3-hydroxy-L-aspartate ammonia-lyase
VSGLLALPVAPEDVEAAARRIEDVARVTPVLRSAALDAAVDAQVLVKAECCQRTGAFKFRGAYNAVPRFRWRSDGGASCASRRAITATPWR